MIPVVSKRKESNDHTPVRSTGMFTLQDGVAVCKLFEDICPFYGYHVALTGGTLYGNGGRKDIDVVFYRIRQVIKPDWHNMVEAFNAQLGFTLVQDFGFCKKLKCGDIVVDALFPEDWVGEYPLDSIQVGDIVDGRVET